MQFCPYCRVSVAGEKICCPLCGGELTGTPAPETEVFPALVRPRFTGSFVLRLIACIALAVSAVCVLVNIAVSTHIWWSLFVVVGAACVWSAAAVGVAYRRDITQNIGWQVVLIPALSFIWDLWTGWRGWSIDFVLPCVCVAGLLSMLALAVLLRMPLRSYAGPFLSVCGIGLLPAVLVLCGRVGVILPSLICAGLSIAMLTVLLAFHGRMLKGELQRRFHL